MSENSTDKTFTQEEVNAIIKARLDKVSAKHSEELSALKKELEPFKKAKRDEHLSNLLKDVTDSNKLSDAIKLASLTDEDSDEDIMKKVKAVVSEREYLQSKVVDDKSAPVDKKTQQETKIEAATNKYADF